LLGDLAARPRSAAGRDQDGRCSGVRRHGGALAEPILARQRLCLYLAAPP
jgi:hypothetical protein